jgi:hypothetical protein
VKWFSTVFLWTSSSCTNCYVQNWNRFYPSNIFVIGFECVE